MKGRSSGLLLILVNFVAPGSGSAFPWYGSRNRRPNSMWIRIHNCWSYVGHCCRLHSDGVVPVSACKDIWQSIYVYFSVINGTGSLNGVLTFEFESSFFRILLTNVLFAMHARKLPRLNSEPYRVSSYIHVYFCSLSF